MARLFSPEGQAQVDQALATAYDVMQVALPIVELVALATPTRADDEIAALIRRYSLPVTEYSPEMTDAQKAAVLRSAATSLVRRSLTDRGVPGHVIDIGVQLAYTTYRAART